ncbi:MAG: DUF4340 domain-containing protein [Phycisphaerae bacterium]|nr:DUF4340 domain-containing protein [Phycisphaerae bacterium]
MKPKTTIVLVILLVVAASGIWLAKTMQRRADEQADAPAGRIFPHTTGEAKKLILESRDGTKLVFVRNQGRWNLIEPRLLPARAEAVDAVVRMMTNLTYRRALPSGHSAGAPSAAATGLDQPRWTVTLITPAGHIDTLHVGSPAPKVGGDDETYVRAGEEGAVYVVAQDLAALLQRDVKDYRDRTVLPEVQPEAVTAVRVAGRANYTLRKNADGWSLVKPFAARAETSAVQILLRKLTTDLQARRFLAEAPVTAAPFGLDRPQLVVTVTTRPAKKKKTYILLLGSHRDKDVCAMVKGRPEVFTVPEEMLNDLQPDPDSLLAKTLLSFAPADVDRVQVQRDGETLLLRRNGAWSMAQPFAGPAENSAADELLAVLGNLRAERWIPPAGGSEMALPSPRATITLHPRNGEEWTLRIGAQSEDGQDVFCQPGGASAVAVVRGSDINTVLSPARRYWPVTLLPITPGAEIPGLTIDRSDGAFVLAKMDDAWTLAAPVTGRADAKAVQTILKTLRGLRAERIIALGDSLPKAYAAAKDRVTVSLAVRGPGDESARNYRLAVVKIGEKVFAWREGESPTAVGLCPASLYTALTQPLAKGK